MSNEIPQLPTERVRARVLAAVSEGDITRNRRGHRWWLTEIDHRTLTGAERAQLKALLAEGVVRFETAGGYPNGWLIGGYHLATPVVGHRVIRDGIGEPDA